MEEEGEDEVEEEEEEEEARIIGGLLEIESKESVNCVSFFSIEKAVITQKTVGLRLLFLCFVLNSMFQKH